MQEYAAPVKLAGLDHLRALAITLVFIFHYRLFPHPEWIDTIGSFGWTGVDLFFVLSGYLIAGQIFRDIQSGHFSAKTFFIKRFFRILPAYWTVLALYFTIPAFREWGTLPPLWKFLTFTQNFGLDLRYHRAFSHAWSLCIEEQFYFLFPFIVLVLAYFKAGTKSAWLLVALFLAGFFVRLTSWNTFIEPAVNTDTFGLQWFKYIYYPTYNRLDGILTGIALAGLVHYFPKTKSLMEKRSNVLLLTGILLISVAYILFEQSMTFSASVFAYPFIAIAFGCMVAAAIGNYGILNKFRSRISSFVATASYAIYLVHKATIHFAQGQFTKLGVAEDGTLMFLLCMLVSIGGALVLHYIVEKPFLRIRHKILLASNSR